MTLKDPKDISNRIFVMRLTEAESAMLASLAKADNRSKANYLKNQLRVRVREALKNEIFMGEYQKYLDKFAQETAKEFDEKLEKTLKNPKKFGKELDKFINEYNVEELKPGENL